MRILALDVCLLGKSVEAFTLRIGRDQTPTNSNDEHGTWTERLKWRYHDSEGRNARRADSEIHDHFRSLPRPCRIVSSSVRPAHSHIANLTFYSPVQLYIPI